MSNVTENLFITGPPATGKTGMLRRLLAQRQIQLCGFAMQRLLDDGETRAFRLLDLSTEEWKQQEVYSPAMGDIAIEPRPGGRWQGVASTFETKGKAALQRCRDNNSLLVVMDELGICEQDAKQFQQAVLSALDDPRPVLGIIKPKDTPFLNAVRNHPLTAIVPICPRWQAEQILTDFLAQTQKQP